MRRALLTFLLACTSVSAEDYSDVRVEKVVGNLKFGQGAVWAEDGYFLLFTDAPSNQIRKISTQGASVFRENSPGASGLAYDDKGRLYICEARARRIIRLGKKGEVETVAETWEGKRLNGPNDIAVSKSGHVFFTDPAFGSADDTRELDFYGIYRISPKGELFLLAKWATRPNGIALSHDGKTLYVVDSDARAVRAFDVAKSGDISNERTVIRAIEAVPDGVRVDKSGKLLVAAKDVLVYSADGKRLTTIQMPEAASNIVFGETGAATMYVTARTSLYRVRPADGKEDGPD